MKSVEKLFSSRFLSFHKHIDKEEHKFLHDFGEPPSTPFDFMAIDFLCRYMRMSPVYESFFRCMSQSTCFNRDACFPSSKLILHHQKERK